MADMQKTFLLGLGAQKCGTTWLFHYLSSHANVNMGFLKEYHVFDKVHFNDRLAVEKLFWLLRIGFGFFRESDEEKMRRNDFRINTNSYFSYFNSLFEENREIVLTGDITPSYAGLSREELEYIKINLEKLGFKVKVVFLMRDPVDRCISAVRMKLRNSSRTRAWSAVDENLMLSRKYKSYDFEFRTRYDKTIKNIDSIFSANDVFYGFYEEMFCRENIKNLCSFLDISFVEPDFSAEYNVSKTSNVVSDSLIYEVGRHYESVYKFVADRFGENKVKSLWSNFPDVKV